MFKDTSIGGAATFPPREGLPVPALLDVGLERATLSGAGYMLYTIC